MTSPGQAAAAEATEVRSGQMDPDSADWVRSLKASGHDRDAALLRLHTLLVRIARSEARRRSAGFGVTGPELDDLAHQAAADALLLITAKIGEFRGESRFTTWAFKFVMFEVAGKINRHYWQRPTVALDDNAWERLPGRLGMQPEAQSEWRELIAVVRRAVEEDLTDKQRRVFVALVITGMPLDVLAAELGSNRNAVYKTMFDARRKVRAALVTDGLVSTITPERGSGRVQ